MHRFVNPVRSRNLFLFSLHAFSTSFCVLGGSELSGAHCNEFSIAEWQRPMLTVTLVFISCSLHCVPAFGHPAHEDGCGLHLLGCALPEPRGSAWALLLPHGCYCYSTTQSPFLFPSLPRNLHSCIFPFFLP